MTNPMPDSNHGSAASEPPGDARMSFVASDNAADLLASLGGTLLVSTYQAGKLLVIRSRGGRLSVLPRTFAKAMGVAADLQRLMLVTRNSVWDMRNSPELAPQIPPQGAHDACYVPRINHMTGDMLGHELAMGTAEAGRDVAWIVNTRFSCLCTLSDEHCFVPRWRPTFISELAAEDRCHLNGLAMQSGRPRYVSALGETDSQQGWRENKAAGGIVIDVTTGDIIARGLCMPHSPRLHSQPGQERLWLLNSGRGELVTLDRRSGQVQTAATLPGYTRGLAFAGPYALVGLSKIRETSTFGGLPIAERAGDLQCGVWFVHHATGRIAGFIAFEGPITEIFDVQFLTGPRFPAVIGLEKDTIDGIFVAPPEAWQGKTPTRLAI